MAIRKRDLIHTGITLLALTSWPVMGTAEKTGGMPGILSPANASFEDSDFNRDYGELNLRIDENGVSVDLDQIPLAGVLNRIAAITGIHVWISESVRAEPVTDQFQNMPLEQALKRLLRGQSFALIHRGTGDDQAVTDVFVVAKAGQAPSNSNGQGQVSDQIDPNVLVESLAPGTLPDHMKDALLEASAPIPSELQHVLAGSKPGAMAKLLERLEAGNARGSDATRQLRENLRQIQSQSE
jgi:hypothetical protein